MCAYLEIQFVVCPVTHYIHLWSLILSIRFRI